MFNRSASSYFPSLNTNAVLQLILAMGVTFVTLGLVHAIMLIVQFPPQDYENILTNIALGNVHAFPSHFWTLFTFGLFHIGFWELVSNMIWLYCFGNLVQMLIGYKQVIPLFIYSLLVAGIFYLLSQLIPARAFSSNFLLGPQAGILGLCVAAITLSPQYRFYFTPTFSVPLYVIACIFLFFMILNTGLDLAKIFQLAGGGLMGFGYIKLLRNGYKPGDWMYDIYDRMERMVTPQEHVAWKKDNNKRKRVLKNLQRNSSLSQSKIDDILDKINQRGYNALSTEEKEILMRASKENK